MMKSPRELPLRSPRTKLPITNVLWPVRAEYCDNCMAGFLKFVTLMRTYTGVTTGFYRSLRQKNGSHKISNCPVDFHVFNRPVLGDVRASSISLGNNKERIVQVFLHQGQITKTTSIRQSRFRDTYFRQTQSGI